MTAVGESRRGNGEGSKPCVRRVNGVAKGYQGQIWVNGKRENVYGVDAPDVRRQYRELLDRAEAGAPVKDSRVTVKSWFDTWRTTSLPAQGKAQSTVDQYTMLVRVHAIPALGDKPLSRVQKSDLDGVLTAMSAAGKADSTRRSTYAALRNLFTEAVDNNLLKDSPMAKVRRPKLEDQEEARSLEDHEVRALVADLAEHSPVLLDIVQLCLLTGLRRGEVLGLHFTDEKKGQLQIRTQVTRASDGLKVRKLKTAGSKRSIDITPPLAAVIKRRRAAQAQAKLAAPAGTWTETGLMFTTGLGTFLDPRNVNRWMEQSVKRLGLADVSPHTLRHSAATFMLDAGVDMKVLQKVLGHSSFSITSDIYAHVAPVRQAEAMAKLAEALGW